MDGKDCLVAVGDGRPCCVKDTSVTFELECVFWKLKLTTRNSKISETSINNVVDHCCVVRLFVIVVVIA